SGSGKIFFRNVQLSDLVPQIATIDGPFAGGAAHSPALTDFLLMTTHNLDNSVCSPQVIHSATGEKVELAQFATAAAHASVSGNIHRVANDDAHAIDLAKKLMSYLPSNNLEDPPHQLSDTLSLDPIQKFNEIIPENPKAP